MNALANLPMGTTLVIHASGSFSRWTRDMYGELCVGAEYWPHTQKELMPQIEWHMRRGENIIDERVGGAP